MKLLPFVALGICLVTTLCQAAPKVLLAQAQPNKIAQVKAGTLKTAHASWWGFDKADSTEALQNAINSGVPKLIVDNMGSDWIIGKPLHLVSNQTIIFEDGVVIQAKKDAFHKKNDSLFNGNKINNFALIGKGNATFRMRRADYDNPKLYSKAEWRMGIKLVDCSDVIIRGLSITETGGDGLYLGASRNGYNHNVLIENCHFDNNYRLGMAVISAENLMIRNCTFNATLGTNPNSGIDFEPNHAGQRLVNIVVEDSVFNDSTKGDGIHFFLSNLDGDSKPISITFNRCRIKGNARGMLSTTIRGKETSNLLQGTITLNNCYFDHNQVQLRNASIDSVRYFFNGCIVDYSGELANDESPIRLKATDSKSNNVTIGGINFDQTVVIGNEQMPISMQLQRGVSVSDQITGTLNVKVNGQVEPFDLVAFVKAEQVYADKVNSLEFAAIDLSKLQVPAQDSVREGNSSLYLQGAFTFLQYAEKGQVITVNFRAIESYDRDTVVELQGVNGKKIASYKLPLNNKFFPITFTAEETGLYRFVRKSTFSQRIDINSSHRGNGILADNTVRFLTPEGRIYFQVPAGVKEFTISVSTGSPADVALLNAQGREVEHHNNITSLQLFTGSRIDASKSEIWSLKSANAVWLTGITLYDPLVPILSTNPATMLLEK